MTTGAQEKIPGKFFDYGGGVYNVKHLDFGALGDGVNDDTAEIQATIDLASTNGGGTVFIPEGVYIVTQLSLKSNIHLLGAGWSSSLKQKASTSGPLLKLDTINVERTIVENLDIDGNKANQAAANQGIYYINTGGTFTDGDALHRISNVRIHDTLGSGLRLDNGVRTSYFERVFVQRADVHGFQINCTDSVFVDCTTGASGLEGWVLVAPNCRLIGCKAFGSGRITAANGDGFSIENPRITLEACESQDNYNNGFMFVNGTDCLLIGCDADSNDNVGFRFGGTDLRNIVIGSAYNRSGSSLGVNPQAYAVDMGSAALDNYVQIHSFDNATGDITGTETGNTIIIDMIQREGGAMTRREVINSLYGSTAAARTHFRWGRTGAPGANNPSYELKTDASASDPVGEILANDGINSRVALRLDFVNQQLILGTPGSTAAAGRFYHLIPTFSDAQRPAAGVQGRIIFNATDANLNIDDGTNWILPDGTIT